MSNPYTRQSLYTTHNVTLIKALLQLEPKIMHTTYTNTESEGNTLRYEQVQPNIFFNQMYS